MIYESYPWKQDLMQRRRLIKKYNSAKFFAKDDDRAYTVIEKAVFYSAFIIRKLIDCKGKVSDEVDKYLFHLKGISPKKGIDMMHRWPDEDTYDWEHEVTYTKSGADVCNWLIHSYVFFFSYDENGEIDSFYVSSDYDRNKILYKIDLNDWIAYMEFVSSDNVVAVCMHANDQKNDYEYTLKERGTLK